MTCLINNFENYYLDKKEEYNEYVNIQIILMYLLKLSGMKLLVDLSSAQPNGSMKVNGGGESSIVFFKSIVENKPDNCVVVVVFNSNLPDNNDLINWCNCRNIIVIKYRDIDHFNCILANEKYHTVFFPVCYNRYSELSIPNCTRVISIIHDLCDVYYYSMPMVKYGRYPKLGKLEWLGKAFGKIYSKQRTKNYIENHNKILKMSDDQVVFTVTHYSKASFYKYLNTESVNSIEIVYTPDVRADIKIYKDLEDDVLKQYKLQNKKYFMLMAGCRWAKNNAIALFVLDKMFSNKKYKEQLDGFKVIVLGTDDIYKNYFLHHIRNKNCFVFEDYIDRYKVEILYKNAYMFVFPSVLEGFGLPPIEAMKYGTVSACSTSMSIPEVCGDAAIYFDPYNMDSIEMAIIRSFDQELMKEKSNKSIKRVKEINDIRKKDLERFLNIVWKSKY